MNLSKKITIVIFCIAALAAAMSFKAIHIAKDKTKLIIQFENFVGNEILKLDSATYKNELNQSYSVSKLKYYISNIHLRNVNGKEFISNEYFLVNEEEPISKQIELSDLSEGEYNSISFTIGVDSLHNCSGIQSGALDPANGMFWAWNTGYVFMKIEGHSSVSKSPGNIYEFHIGGFMQPTNCIRTFTLKFPNQNLKIAAEKNSLIKIKTDIAEIFKSPAAIDFSEISSVVDFHNATMIADNYKDMFSILGIE